MNFFAEKINNWDDWGRLIRSASAFTPLIRHIFEKENLPLFERGSASSPAAPGGVNPPYPSFGKRRSRLIDVETLPPGTNAVFKVGEYVIKIFIPPEFSEGDVFGTNIDVEIFGMKLVYTQNVPAPMLIADGAVQDKYHFRYMIMGYIHGKSLAEIEDSLTDSDKFTIGQNMRKITDKLNIPCENFTSTDVMQYTKNNVGWKADGFPPSFLEERLAYLADFKINESAKVYCHGDLHCDNILIDDNLNVYILDFADAMHAPAEYELVYIVSSLFCFEGPYMQGYFGEYTTDDIVDLCMTWLPVHAHGQAVTEGNLKPVSDIISFDVMRERLRNLIEGSRNK